MTATIRDFVIVQIRRAALIALVFFMGTSSVGPQLTEAEIAERHESYIAHVEKRNPEVWQAIVSKIAEDLRITHKPQLAERIAHAVEDSTTEFDVEPWLMVALIRVESSGNPNAISYKGARGLTQIMPNTGRGIAKDLGIKWEGVQMLHDVETNVRFGTYYLSKLLKRFGDEHAAVAAYYWGPQNIAKRLRTGRALPTRYPSEVFSHIHGSRPWASS